MSKRLRLSYGELDISLARLTPQQRAHLQLLAKGRTPAKRWTVGDVVALLGVLFLVGALLEGFSGTGWLPRLW